MKYIMFQCSAENRQTLLLPVIFPDVLTHKDVAQAIERVKVQPAGALAGWWMWPKAVSAGFFHNGRCHDRSESLNLKAHDDDTEIVEAYLEGMNSPLSVVERVSFKKEAAA